MSWPIEHLLITGPRLRWLVWLVYTTAWTIALLTPQPAEFADRVLDENISFLCAKSLHVGAYAFLAVLGGWLRTTVSGRWLLVGFMSTHAMGTEYFQGYVPLRTPSWGDVGLDHVGIVVGLAISCRWWVESPRTAVSPMHSSLN